MISGKNKLAQMIISKTLTKAYQTNPKSYFIARNYSIDDKQTGKHISSNTSIPSPSHTENNSSTAIGDNSSSNRANHHQSKELTDFKPQINKLKDNIDNKKIAKEKLSIKEIEQTFYKCVDILIDSIPNEKLKKQVVELKTKLENHYKKSIVAFLILSLFVAYKYRDNLLSFISSSISSLYRSATALPPEIITNIPLNTEHYQVSHWEDELTDKITKLKKNNKPGSIIEVAICGTAGSGKTELAKAYAAAYLQGIEKKHYKAEDQSIVWHIVAQEPSRLWDKYRELARELNIEINRLPEEQDQVWQDRITYQVSKSLAKRSDWLIIFDNVEKMSDIQKYIPSNHVQNGTILFTTRNADILTAKQRLNISRGLMPKEATRLLAKITGLKADDDAQELAEDLDYLPLYLTISAFDLAAYNENNVPDKWSYASYKEHLNRLSSQQIEQLHQSSTEKLSGYNKTQQAVVRSALSKSGAEAKELLLFCSYLLPNEISHDLIRSFIQIKYPQLAEAGLKNEFQKLLKEIQSLSLLQPISNKPAYDIHRVIQKIVKEEYGNLNKDTANDIINIVIFSPSTYEINNIYNSKRIKVYKQILPNLIHLSLQENLLNLVDIQLKASLLKHTGIGCNLLKNFEKGEYFLNQSLNIFRLHHKYNLETASVLLNLAYSYRVLEIKKAKNLVEEALSIFIQNNNEIGKALALKVLATCYRDSKNVEKCRMILENEILGIYKNYYGEDHQETAKIWKELGITYRRLGNMEKSKVYLEKALQIFEKLEDKDDLEIARIIRNQSDVDRELKDYSQSIEKLKKVLDIFKTYYGEDSYEVARTLLKLSRNNQSLENFKESKEQLEKALLIFKQCYSENHPEAIKILEFSQLLNNSQVKTNDIKLRQHEKLLKRKFYQYN